ncbi:helix-turn-helix domain-containing protein [Pyxidicoccus fallax]|uniref:Helix-turn-helix domain-containing protein n=1 Tax=Pyxidicoccus fallax TaxID=394095 RepID=A0A848LDR4_9BACT|nr:helix-turn-helix domain-containing protein [Pyxidicoccus fallax]NMO16362.1 helix-turn-helix domain-containing protein [Pyxidicoccus fallax]NPC78166.1 helix-turn-helix domain-containing protein [Pyxidicoccus fallax]
MTAIPVDAYVLETLMPDLVGHDRSPSAFLVYLHLWYRTAGAKERRCAASLARLAEDTGLSKSAVQAALRLLKRRKLVKAERASLTAVPVYEVLRPWVRK